MDDVSKKLRDLREDHDLLQDSMAKIIDCNRATISNYENGRDVPSPVIIKYCQYFHVSADWLLGLTTDRTPGGSKLSEKLHSINTVAALHNYLPVDVSQLDMLLDAILAYYRSGAPAGNTPSAVLMSLLSAMYDLYYQLPSGTVSGVLNASNAVATAGLGAHDVLAAYLDRCKIIGT